MAPSEMVPVHVLTTTTTIIITLCTTTITLFTTLSPLTHAFPAALTTPTPTDVGLQDTENSLLVNQLAIMTLLNTTCHTSFDRWEELAQEINNLWTETNRQKEEQDMKERDLAELKSEISTLNTLIKFYSIGDQMFSYDNKWFHVNTDLQLTWSDARTWCQTRGGDLAMPTSELIPFMEEVKNKVHIPGDVELWLGASDHVYEAAWQWASGKSLHLGAPWENGEPNNHNGNEDCLMMVIYENLFQTLNDGNCSSTYHFVCGTVD